MSDFTVGKAFDVCFSRLAFAWSFAFVGEVWEKPAQCRGLPAAVSWTSVVNRFLLDSILSVGRELDRSVMAGEVSLSDSGLLSWACRVAPAAQGGYASREAQPCELLSNSRGSATFVEDRPSQLPQVIDLPRGMVVLMKPVDWEVDGLTSEGGGARLLSGFLQRALPDARIARAPELDFGFVHRLDVPSSGLVLGGTSVEGLLSLKWQIAVYAIHRQYITANHGCLRVSSMDVAESIDATTTENLRSVADEAGKPARSHLALLAGLGWASNALCVLAITIHTGRRHQIRAHTRHAGHPTVTDARYAPRDVVVRGEFQLRPSCPGLRSTTAVVSENPVPFLAGWSSNSAFSLAS